MGARVTKNPALYRQMSEPFGSVEEANTASEGFFAELAEMRKRYRMRDVYCVAQFSYVHPDGGEAEAMTSLGLGDQFKHEGMLAHSLGVVQTERQEYIGSLLSSAIKRPKRES